MRKVVILIITCLIFGGVSGGWGNNVDKGNNKNKVSEINNKDNITNKENKDVEKEDKVENKEKESTEETSNDINKKENDDKSESEDTNVDLSEFEVGEKTDKFSSTMSGVTMKDNSIKFGFQKFTGVCTITKLNNNPTISYESELEEGKMNIVILDLDYKVLKVLEANKSDTINLNFSDTGEYIIKVVGDEAYKGKVEITIEKNTTNA